MKNIYKIILIFICLFCVDLRVYASGETYTCSYSNGKLTAEFTFTDDSTFFYNPTTDSPKVTLNGNLGKSTLKDKTKKISNWAYDVNNITYGEGVVNEIRKNKACLKYLVAYQTLGQKKDFNIDLTNYPTEYPEHYTKLTLTEPAKEETKTCDYLASNKVEQTDVIDKVVRYYNDGTALANGLEINNWTVNNNHYKKSLCFNYLIIKYDNGNISKVYLSDDLSKYTSSEYTIYESYNNKKDSSTSEKDETHSVNLDCPFHLENKEKDKIGIGYTKYGSAVVAYENNSRVGLANEMLVENEIYITSCPTAIYKCKNNSTWKLYYNESGDKCKKYVYGGDLPDGYVGKTKNINKTEEYTEGGQYNCSQVISYKQQLQQNPENYASIKQTAKKHCQEILKKINYSDESNCVNECIELFETEFSETLDGAEKDGCYLSEGGRNFLKNIIKWVKLILPVLLIVHSIFDFLRAIANEDEGMKRAKKHLINRLIAIALIYTLPSFIEFFLERFGFVYEECSILLIKLLK